MEIDFLIIGQGLAGSALGYRLIQEGKKVLFHRSASLLDGLGLGS